ncbi:hypothetical protein XELAEV_18012827mg [Xenopus laevis]|uniref:Uncharacterized protein n=1 Tax=Xenopus laevis TaxID=8355 RepID=A0A974DND2_XENLA|nr:hypothetical protein XELAEV_18012827mg [Xenopus laevis]
MELHGCTLAEYYRLKRIPRGLRVHLQPTLFSDNLEYCKKFEGILNKCSLDIITLTIEYIQKELLTVAEQVSNLETQLAQTANQEELSNTKARLEESILRFRLETETRKREKFLRDAEDYTSGRIYRWTPGRPHVTTPYFRGRRTQAQAPRGIRRAGQQAAIRSSSGETASQPATDSTGSSFLGEDSAPSSSGEREANAPEASGATAVQTRQIRNNSKTAPRKAHRQ